MSQDPAKEKETEDLANDTLNNLEEEFSGNSEELEIEDFQEKPTFEKLGVSEEVSNALAAHGWEYPTEIQEKSLPFSLAGKDLAGFAQTGTGKTGAFLITFAEKLIKQRTFHDKKTKHPLALILCPTRELAVQIEEEAQCLLGNLDARTLAVYGGVSIEPQISALKKGVDLVVATPGRLLDLEEQSEIKLSQLKLFICDEVDRMFDMGFSKDVESILSKLPKNIQKLAFSATSDERSRELCEKYLNKPEFVSLNHVELTPETIKQHLIICDNEDKIKLLISLLKAHDPLCAIVFTNTKLVAAWLLLKLEKNNFNAKMISGDLPQNKRTKLITDIKNGDTKILIATDVASRGLHISGVSHVYNFDLPDDASNYIHRIGRTARAGASGESYSFICEDYAHNYESIKKLLGDKLPMASLLDKTSLEGIEDLAKNPYGEEEHRTPFLHKETREYTRDSAHRSFEKPSRFASPRKNEYSRNDSFDKKRSERSFDNKRTQRDSSYKNKFGKDSYEKKTFSPHSKKPPAKKGLFSKIISKFFPK